MSNPDIQPRPENLTRAGMGQPPKGLERLEVTLTPELKALLEQVAKKQRWKRNYLIEQAHDDGNAIAPLEWALEYLESLMPESEFVAFCDEL
jgi:hypothetical protein